MSGRTRTQPRFGPALRAEGESVALIGGGFIGSRIAADAVARGLRTTMLTRRATVDPALIAKGLELHVGDAADADAVDKLLSRPAHVIFCAGGRLPTASVDDPTADAVGTLAPLLTVLDAMRRRPGSRLTYLSSGGTVYGHPQTHPVDEDHPCHPVVPYGVARLAAEGYVCVYSSLHGVPGRILRLANVYGPDQPSTRGQGVVATLLDAALRHRPAPVYGDGSVARDFVHVDDVSDVVLTLPPPPDAPLILNVGTGRARTVMDIVRTVERVTGRPLLLDLRPARPFDVPRISLSIARLRAVFPYAPRSVVRGIEETWAAMTQQTAAEAEGM